MLKRNLTLSDREVAMQPQRFTVNPSLIRRSSILVPEDKPTGTEVKQATQAISSKLLAAAQRGHLSKYHFVPRSKRPINER